mgnify:FL=1
MPDGKFSPNLFHTVTYNGLRAIGNTNSSCSNKAQKNSIGSKKITVKRLGRGGRGKDLIGYLLGNSSQKLEEKISLVSFITPSLQLTLLREKMLKSSLGKKSRLMIIQSVSVPKGCRGPAFLFRRRWIAPMPFMYSVKPSCVSVVVNPR